VTAYAALTEVAHLVHGALGGLASAFLGAARTLGVASVAGTTRSSSLAAARASALPYEEVIASENLLAAPGGQRFDVVIDPVGGQVRTDSPKVMAPLGRMLLVGNASREWQRTAPINSLWLGSLAIAGFPPATTSRRIPTRQVQVERGGAMMAPVKSLVSDLDGNRPAQGLSDG
jgi:NADPH2:quinone reductase